MTDILKAAPFDSRAYPHGMVTLDVDLAAVRTKEARRAASECRRGLLVDYLLAAEDAAAAPADESLAKKAAKARRTLANYLVAEGEYPTVEDATTAMDAGRVYGTPVPGKTYTEVPF
jgi:hypothetical protein